MGFSTAAFGFCFGCRMTSRLRKLADWIVPTGEDNSAAAAAAPSMDSATLDAQNDGAAAAEESSYQTGHALMSGVLRQELAEVPRVSFDYDKWSAVELLDRARQLGASDAQLNAALLDSNPHGDLMSLVQELMPPPPTTVNVEDFTVERTASVEEMVATLDKYGALVIKHCADPALIAQVEEELEPFGAWSANPEDRIPGSRVGRMGMNGLMHAPSAEHLLTHPTVLSVANGLMGSHCRRLALKEIEIFAVQPGQGKQPFHREDQFWPWHHEPHHWAVSTLWAIDDFTPENGGTRLFPYSHRNRMREARAEILFWSHFSIGITILPRETGSG